MIYHQLTHVHLNMQVQLYLLMSLLYTALCVDLIYYVKDSDSPGTYLGNIAADVQSQSRVPSEIGNLIWFSQLQQGVNRSSQLFNVSRTGKLYTAQTLDSESLCRYNRECYKIVVVAVRLKESFVKILEIKVIVNDINDHRPEFPSKQVNLEFSEGDGKGVTKLIPNAIDRDVGVLNSQITYNLIKDFKEPFALSVSENVDGTSTLGIKLEERLDRERKDSYKIQVAAEDGGVPPLESNLEILITVADINDNAPTFIQNRYNISFKNKHKGTARIAILSATDLDSGKNGRVSYHFSFKTSTIDKSFFELNKITGEVFLKEKSASHQNLTCNLFIEARDGGSPPLSSIAMILVNVINQQNKAPNIDVNFISAPKGQKASISEGIKVGSFIAFVKITDNDIGQNGEVICNLRHDKFELESLGLKKYKVIVRKPVDRETESFVNFRIICRDKGSPSLETIKEFNVELKDINDVQPEFSKGEFKFLIYENQKPNFPVGLVSARDPDEELGGKLTYFLLPNNNNKRVLPFEISDFGFLSTTNFLDREQQEIYKFSVFVRDNGTPSLNNTVNVTVEVMDENDNVPYFIFSNFNSSRLNIHYHSWSMRNITELKAFDNDSSVNAFLRYEILGGNEKQLFALNPYTGMLSFSREVYQNDAGSYNLRIVVKDNGTPVLSATTNFSLTLTISNKTSEMLTMVQNKSDKKIHLHFVIVIVFVAVTVSVSIVVTMALCIIESNGRRHPPCNRRRLHSLQKPQNEKKQLENVCQPKTIQTEVLRVMSTDPGKNGNLQSIESRRESHSKHETGHNWKDSASRLHCDILTEGIHQRTFEETPVISDGRRVDCTVIAPESYSELSAISSCTDSGHGWSEGDIAYYEELPALYAFPIKQANKTNKRPQIETVSCTMDTSTTSRYSNKLHGGRSIQCGEYIGVPRRTGSPNLSSKPLKSFAPYSKPLPEVPNSLQVLPS